MSVKELMLFFLCIAITNVFGSLLMFSADLKTLKRKVNQLVEQSRDGEKQ